MQVMLQTLPRTAEEFVSMQVDFVSPSHVAAFFIVAICSYSENRDECFKMIDILKGPQKMTTMEKQFFCNRMMGKSGYIGKAYFEGAKPDNDYTPKLPYTVFVEENQDTYSEAGYATVYVKNGGAESPRPLKLRKKGKHWFLWEYTGLLADIHKPISSDPWR